MKDATKTITDEMNTTGHIDEKLVRNAPLELRDDELDPVKGARGLSWFGFETDTFVTPPNSPQTASIDGDYMNRIYDSMNNG